MQHTHHAELDNLSLTPGQLGVVLALLGRIIGVYDACRSHDDEAGVYDATR